MAKRRFVVEAELRAKDNASRVVGRVQGAFSSFGSFLSSRFVITLGDVTQLLAGVGRAMWDVVEVAGENETAVAKVNAALQNSGEYSAAAAAEMQTLSAALEVQKNVAQSVVNENLALALSFTKSADSAAALTSAAIDFAQGADIGITEAVRRLGRAMKGSVEDISKFDDRILDLTKSQLAAGKATELLAETFAGRAAAAMDTWDGLLQKLVLSYERLKDMVGQAITKNATFRGLLDDLNAAMRSGDLAEGIEDIAEGVATLASAMASAGKYVKRFGEALRLISKYDPSSFLFNVRVGMQSLDQAAGDAAQSQGDLSKATGELNGLLFKTGKTTQDVSRWIAELTGNTKALREETDRTTLAQKRYETKLKEFGLTLRSDVTDSIDENERFLEKLRQSVLAGEATWGQYAAAVKKVTAANAAAALQLQGVDMEVLAVADGLERAADASNEYARATDGAVYQTQRLDSAMASELRQLATTTQQLRFTSAEYDRLAAAKGRVAATTAAVQQGGQLVLGGTRILLPGGGSRLVSEPGGSYGTSWEDSEYYTKYTDWG